MQFFELVYDKTAPTSGVINVLNYYKDNSTPISLSVTDASFMKVWINQTAVGTTSDPEIPTTWSAYSSTWTPNFSTEGTNYVHAIFMDEVGNKSGVINSSATIFDKTAPIVSSVVIANDADITTNQTVIVRVSATDATSGVQKTTLSGNLDQSSTTEFIWTDTDRTNGYKDCTVVLAGNTDPSHRETKTVYATATDFAGNTSERNSDTIVLYTGGIDPVIVLKTPNDKVIGDHYGETAFKYQLHVLTGITDLIADYKVWGDFADTAGTDPTPEPSTWTTWPAGQTVVSMNKYLTSIDGDKYFRGKVRLTIAAIADTVATYANLPATANDGAIFEVTADETKAGKTTTYRFSTEKSAFEYYGDIVDGDETKAVKEIESAKVHHSEAIPTIVLTSNKSILSDKETHNKATLTATMTTSCNINEYKVVAYATAEAAAAGTSADVTNVDLVGTTEIVSGGTWTPELTENKLVLAIAGEGQKFLVVYAKNLCDKWGKSNVYSISVDLTAPVGTISVQQYYKEASGFTASATDTGSAVSKMQCWVDPSAGTEEPPQSSTEYDYSANPTAAQVDWTNVVQGRNYVHIKYTDEVGNSGVTHSAYFIYDNVAPVECSISAPQLTNTTTITVTLSASDPTSGMGQMKIFGDVNGAATAEQAEWVPYSTTASIVLTNGDGTKTIQALFKDNAGNVTGTAVSTTTVLDTGSPAATIVLFNNADTEALKTYVNTVNIRAHIGATDNLSDVVEYKVWGGITSAATEDEAVWQTFTVESGKTYMSVPLALTSGDGLKTVNTKVKDKAGNISSLASASVTLDTTAPEINVSAVDYNIISKVHEPRLTSSGEEIPNTFDDKMTFKFSCGVKLTEWKVCVNEPEQQASTAQPIGTTGGSINMTGTTVEPNTEVLCTIMGADFAATTKVNDTDGAYEVIVYGKDEAGNWSAVHVINV